MSVLTDRMLRAARLDASLYEEVEHDTTVTRQAALVVVIASIATGIGNLDTGGLPGLVRGSILALLGWAFWSWIIYLVGTRLLAEPQTEADYGQLLRTIGFASAPGVINVLGIVPILGGLAMLVAQVWTIAATVVAVRQALDYRGTGRAVMVCVVSWVGVFVAGMVLAFLFSFGS